MDEPAGSVHAAKHSRGPPPLATLRARNAAADPSLKQRGKKSTPRSRAWREGKIHSKERGREPKQDNHALKNTSDSSRIAAEEGCLPHRETEHGAQTSVDAAEGSAVCREDHQGSSWIAAEDGDERQVPLTEGKQPWDQVPNLDRQGLGYQCPQELQQAVEGNERKDVNEEMPLFLPTVGKSEGTIGRERNRGSIQVVPKYRRKQASSTSDEEGGQSLVKVNKVPYTESRIPSEVAMIRRMRALGIRENRVQELTRRYSGTRYAASRLQDPRIFDMVRMYLAVFIGRQGGLYEGQTNFSIEMQIKNEGLPLGELLKEIYYWVSSERGYTSSVVDADLRAYREWLLERKQQFWHHERQRLEWIRNPPRRN